MGTLETASVGFIWLFEDPVEPAHLAYLGYDVDFDGRLALAAGGLGPFVWPAGTAALGCAFASLPLRKGAANAHPFSILPLSATMQSRPARLAS
jgi:hypothetical protein